MTQTDNYDKKKIKKSSLSTKKVVNIKKCFMYSLYLLKIIPLRIFSHYIN